MRQDFFEYWPQFKLIFSGNHRPKLSTVDDAMRRRFHLVPFNFTVPASERDLLLKEKLIDEWSGILGWMIGGCLEWQRHGLQPPGIVRDATSSFFADEDVIGRWIFDCCETGKGRWSTSAALYASWCAWCASNGEQAGSQKCFSQNLGTRGFEHGRPSGQRSFSGIAIRQR